MLSRGECLGPAAVQRDKDEHEALGVKGGPAEEEGRNNNNLKYQIASVCSYNERNNTKHLDHTFITLAQVPAQGTNIILIVNCIFRSERVHFGTYLGVCW